MEAVESGSGGLQAAVEQHAAVLKEADCTGPDLLARLHALKPLLPRLLQERRNLDLVGEGFDVVGPLAPAICQHHAICTFEPPLQPAGGALPSSCPPKPAAM